MMRYSLVLFLLFAFAKAEFSTAQNQAQVKIEREERIAISEFPKNAIDVVSQISKSRKKIKYFKETDGYLTSYEAKYKYNGYKYSVECDEKGDLIDIEVQIKKREIKAPVLEKIKTSLKTISSLFKIEKIQQQYVIKKQDSFVISMRIEGKEFDNYEMIVAFRENRKIYRKELLFSKDGVLLQQRDIKRLEYDFLLF